MVTDKEEESPIKYPGRSHLAGYAAIQRKAEKDSAKLERWKPRWGQPKHGKLEKPLPKPSIETVDNGGGGDGSEDDEHDDSDGDSVNEPC